MDDQGETLNQHVSRRGAAGRGDGPFGPAAWRRFPPSKMLTGFAIGALFAALLANEFFAARFLSADGLLDATTTSSIRWVQGVLGLTGISVLLRWKAALFALIVGLTMGNLLVFKKRVTTALEVERVTEGQLAELRKALLTTGHVGFVSDETKPQHGYIDTKRYYLTQYALAPVVVEPGPTRDWIVGNFKSFDPAQTPDQANVVRDFGDGIILFRRKSQ
jgi:hypothetical protein